MESMSNSDLDSSEAEEGETVKFPRRKNSHRGLRGCYRSVTATVDPPPPPPPQETCPGGHLRCEARSRVCVAKRPSSLLAQILRFASCFSFHVILTPPVLHTGFLSFWDARRFQILDDAVGCSSLSLSSPFPLSSPSSSPSSPAFNPPLARECPGNLPPRPSQR